MDLNEYLMKPTHETYQWKIEKTWDVTQEIQSLKCAEKEEGVQNTFLRIMSELEDGGIAQRERMELWITLSEWTSERMWEVMGPETQGQALGQSCNLFPPQEYLAKKCWRGELPAVS